MEVPEAVLSVKKFGGLRFDVDVLTIQPWREWMGKDNSLDSYVRDGFGSIHRVAPAPAVRTLPLGRMGPLVRLPDQFRLVNRKMLQRAEDVLEDHQAIITWSQWHSIHLVGLRLKERHPALPWIVQMSDPWSNNPFVSYSRWERRVNERLEGRVVNAATELMFPSSETADLVMSRHSKSLRKKVHIIPHLFDSDLYPTEVGPSTGRLTLRYVGAFYGPRTPEPLFQGLALLHRRDPERVRRMKVELVGNTPLSCLKTESLRSLPAGTVECIPPVNYRTSLRLMKEAHVLLVVDAPAKLSVFLPSKLVDYVGARRPIVGITPPGAARGLIEKYGGWVADPTDPEEIANALSAAQDATAAQQVGRAFGNDATVKQYDRQHVAERVEALVMQAIAELRT